MEEVKIRVAAPQDAEALLEIYAPYVEETAITFEYEVPTAAEFRTRVERTLRHYPYFVAERDGRALGYAYAGPFVGRAAYDWAAEVSIYVRKEARKTGVGKKLYTALESALKAQGILNLEACIGVPEQDDERLDHNSVNFHAHLGYRMVGIFQKCGYKFGRWYNMAWMEKFLDSHAANQPPVKPFPEIRESLGW